MDPGAGMIRMLPSKLLELLKEEYKLPKSVRKDVQYLSRELTDIYAILSIFNVAYRWEQYPEETKIWACEFRDASYDMEDAIDTFIIRAARRPINFLDFSKVRDRYHISRTIEGFMRTFQQLSKRRSVLNVDNNAVRHASRIDPRIMALYRDESYLIGIDEPREELIKMLSIGDKETKIVSVLGFGGLGKTTLAKVVYTKINPHFECRAFVPVGPKPDIRKTLNDIIHEIMKSKDERMYHFDERRLIDTIRAYLEGKRYLIVVDDIWETSTWEILKIAFVDCNCGSRIITTTRISHISKEIGEVYRIKELSDMNSRKLFYRTFHGEEKHQFSAEFNEISEEVIRKCHGIPLAIITIASALVNIPQGKWSSVYDSIGFGLDDDNQVENMKWVFLLSYNELPCHLRTCLLYMGIFPEKSSIDVWDLILRWMAEGFIQEENSKEPFEIGLSYLLELIDRTLVIPIEEKDSGLLVGCRVHGMILPLIRDLSCKWNFALLRIHPCIERQPAAIGKIRRLALQKLAVKYNYKDLLHVRSFIATMCQANLMPIFSSFKVLRVLALDNCIGMECYSLEHISILLHLRYLRVSHTPVGKLPEDLGCLKFLQTLVLDDTGIEELPRSLHKLTQLMCLHVDKKMSVPEWIGNLTSLLELEMYHEVLDVNKCSTEHFLKELGKLTNLRFLKTAIRLQDEGQGSDFLESLRKLEKIQSIDISFPSVLLEMNVVTMEPNFALSSSLRVLDLSNLQFPRLPPWINAQHLPELCKLTVVVSDKREQDLEILGKFRELRKLVLVIVNEKRLNLVVCGCGGFQNLRSFDVTVPLKFGDGAMPRLECLKFSIQVMGLKDANIGLEFGLENLSALCSVVATLDCTGACLAEVYEAEAVLKRALDTHPNHPVHEVRRINEDKMGPADAESRMMNRRNYKILQANLLGADFDIQQADLHELNNETIETRTCSMPKEHPTVAKILRTLQELWVSDDPTSSVDDLSMGLKILERGEEPSNLKLPLLKIITDNFCDVLKVGHGGFGEVYKGILRDGTSIAVKKLFNTRTIDDKMFHQEVTSLMMVRHQNIVRFLGYCSHTEARAFKIMEGKIIMAEERERLLCFEYVSNGSLEDYITDELNGLEWNTRYQIIKGICDGLHHLHVEKHIIHMDLKPANILLDERMVPKITDFGLSRLDSKTHTMSVERLFTRGYCAPEYLDDGKTSPKSDIYSLGVIILEIVTGSKEQQSNKKVLKKWRHRWRKTVEQTPLCYKQVSNCLNLARSCTHPNPTKRPKISNIIDELINTDKETSIAIDEFQELEDMLAVDPLKTHLRLELNKEISCSFELTNTTDHYFAFRISTNSVRRYGIHPLKDIVAPQSKCSVTITLQALKEAPSQNHCKDDFSLQSTRVDGSLTSKDISEDMFDGETVDNANLTVVLGK